MPNWVENTVIVSGFPNERARFLDMFSQEFATGEGLFQAIKPMPVGTRDWYQWRVVYWGCKWDVTDFSYAEYEDYFQFGFQTPWSHPYQIIRGLADMFPDLSFEVFYCEDGDMEHSGWYEIERGDRIDTSEYPQNILSSAEARHQILSHTWGTDFFDTEEESEESVTTNRPERTCIEVTDFRGDTTEFPEKDEIVYEEQLKDLLF